MINVAGTTQLLLVRTYIGASPVLVDPTLLARGHHSVGTSRGLGDGVKFDFRPRTYPEAAAGVYTNMFRAD